jgi:hypothetical protein
MQSLSMTGNAFATAKFVRNRQAKNLGDCNSILLSISITAAKFAPDLMTFGNLLL